MTLDRIHEAYSNTFFCQLGKWGSTLTIDEAKALGLPIDSEEKATPSKRLARKPKSNIKNNNNNNNNKEE